MTVESRYVHPTRDIEPHYQAGVVHRLTEPDAWESGGDDGAAKAWRRVVGICRFLTDPEVRFVNFLRELYRGCWTTGGPSFVPGGSLVFHGANIRVLGDRQSLYNTILCRSGLKQRTRKSSSHENADGVLQLEIPIHSAGVVLVGYGPWTPSGGCDHTWLQTERAPYDSPVHLVNYIEHKLIHQQIGPFGHSRYTEKKNIPLCTNWCKARHALALLTGGDQAHP